MGQKQRPRTREQRRPLRASVGVWSKCFMCSVQERLRCLKSRESGRFRSSIGGLGEQGGVPILFSLPGSPSLLGARQIVSAFQVAIHQRSEEQQQPPECADARIIVFSERATPLTPGPPGAAKEKCSIYQLGGCPAYAIQINSTIPQQIRRRTTSMIMTDFSLLLFFAFLPGTGGFMVPPGSLIHQETLFSSCQPLSMLPGHS